LRSEMTPWAARRCGQMHHADMRAAGLRAPRSRCLPRKHPEREAVAFVGDPLTGPVTWCALSAAEREETIGAKRKREARRIGEYIAVWDDDDCMEAGACPHSLPR